MGTFAYMDLKREWHDAKGMVMIIVLITPLGLEFGCWNNWIDCHTPHYHTTVTMSAIVSYCPIIEPMAFSQQQYQLNSPRLSLPIDSFRLPKLGTWYLYRQNRNGNTYLNLLKASWVPDSCDNFVCVYWTLFIFIVYCIFYILHFICTISITDRVVFAAKVFPDAMFCLLSDRR